MFLFHHWLELSITTRQKIASQFGIIKRGSTEVVDNQIKSDGYNIKEIEQALNVDAIQTYLNTQEADMTKLWENLIAKIEDRDYQIKASLPVEEVKKWVGSEGDAEPIKKKAGRPKKHV